MSDATYVSLKDTAKAIRGALATSFPGVKFSVRGRSYAGGSSIDVSWTDGPRSAKVDPVVQFYSGATFDGMTDCKNYHETALPDGRRVHWGTDFVFCRREISNREEKIAVADGLIREMCALLEHPGKPELDRFGNSYVTDLARSMVHDAGPDGLLSAFRRVVMCERDYDPTDEPKPDRRRVVVSADGSTNVISGPWS